MWNSGGLKLCKCKISEKHHCHNSSMQRQNLHLPSLITALLFSPQSLTPCMFFHVKSEVSFIHELWHSSKSTKDSGKNKHKNLTTTKNDPIQPNAMGKHMNLWFIMQYNIMYHVLLLLSCLWIYHNININHHQPSN